MPPERWSWLGEPLAIDFANTVRRRGSDYTELLSSGADLRAWAQHEASRVPDPSEYASDIRLDEVRELRDAIFALLLAAAQHEPASPGIEKQVNAALAAVPLIPQLRDGAVELVAPPDCDPLDELLARTAMSAVDLLPSPALAYCDAPSCGQFFMRSRRDQRWCGPACGTRTRVARHALRKGS
ncbi:CGNR zinc finger domain-containing protein [Solirubrobacter ginsenosidimutans]|uniref:CGNR zinc finger domain-containing protein n=1 Tax=Solirubrobacter ginsenosidimutans TaxID=490573 RepID=A0A9X3S4G0_9ACTN|nr:CGNR zinc finger domain-containing protein [Solirubrobacter ginsenosidimutans]MDA0165764.1 CGNR zinc finger domain-containing protein [Solirubrobacter ginsenosidimutans]